MKKKIFSLTIAFVFLLTGAIGLFGCEDPSQPKVKSISCEIDNPHYNSEMGKFIYTWSSDLFINILKSDFTVTAHYADGTIENVTDFIMDIPTIRYPLANENKHYTVKISYKNKSKQFGIDIKKLDPATAKDFIRDTLQDIDVEYTGNDIDVVSQFEGLKGFIDAGEIKINSNTGSRFERELGTYFLTLLSADGAVEKTITWKIIKGRISLPLVNHMPLTYDEDNEIIYVELNIEYDGLEHGISLQHAEGTEHLITIYDNTGTGENLAKYTDVGEYQFTIRTNGNYVFKSSKFDYNEEHSEAFVFMRINKKRLNLSGENALSVTSPVYYKGSAITFADLTTNIPTDLFEIVYFPSNCINPGTYEIIIEPKLSTAKNYAWSDGSEILSHNIHINFQVLSVE